jgi:SAM-dependent methyltransferase
VGISGGERPDQPRLDPGPLMKLSTAYWDSQVLLTANRLGLFDVLADRTLDAQAVAAALKTAPRPTRLLLKACVGLGLLEENSAGFCNAPLSAAFLVSGRGAYMGNAIRYSDNLYNAWGALETALREDRPAMAPETYLGRDAQKTRDFVYGMHDRALGIGRAMVGLVDLAGRRHMLDVGGGPGTYSALLVQRYPDLQSVVLDLPDVVAIAAEIVAGMGVRERVATLPGDYMKTPFPSEMDVVMISGVFHRETEATCRDLIRRAAASLVPGGLLLISDVFTDAGGAHPVFAALFGLNMMLTAPDGGVHADADAARWMAEAGFSTQVRPFPPPMPHRMVIGEKRRAG